MTVDIPNNIRFVKYKGLFDYLGMYRMIKKWFDDRGFYFEEKKYSRRPGEGAGYREAIEIYAEIKMSDYVKHCFEVEIYTFDMEEVPVEKNGIKETWYHGRLFIVLDGKIQSDWEGKWETGKFTKELEKFVNRYFLQIDMLLVHWDKLNYKTHILQTEIEKFLGMVASEAYYDYL